MDVGIDVSKQQRLPSLNEIYIINSLKNIKEFLLLHSDRRDDSIFQEKMIYIDNAIQFAKEQEWKNFVVCMQEYDLKYDTLSQLLDKKTRKQTIPLFSKMYQEYSRQCMVMVNDHPDVFPCHS